jgi:glycosyltransferase involved in cell wall biosynthesis
MTVRRLLAISWEMPPLSGPRAVQVSRLLNHLVALGWESTVVCFGPRSDRYAQDPALASRLSGAGVTLVRVPSLEERLFFRILWRVAPAARSWPDEKWVWIRPAARAARNLARQQRFEAIVTFGQPWSDHLIGLKVRHRTGLPWVAHFSDPWVDSPYLQGGAWQQRIWRRMEADVVRQADAVVFVNRQTADRVMRKYPDAWRDKVHVVPHGFDPADRSEPQAFSDDGRLHIVHTGRFYEGRRTPDALLRAIAALSARRPLARELRLVLVGPIEPASQRLADRLGLGDIVEFTGRVPHAEATRRAACADVLLVIDAPSHENLFLPSKLVDYLPRSKPILALTPPGATADLVQALGYHVVAPGDEQAIAGAVESLLEARRQGRLGTSAQHESMAQQYDIRRTASVFAEILERCA